MATEGTSPVRYAYLGPEGTFSEAALRALVGSLPAASDPAAGEFERIPCVSVADALDAVRRGEVAAALVPLENSIEGSVSETLDELATGDPLQIVREVQLTVSFALLARTGTTIADVTTVTTMPHAEAQVRGWLRSTLPAARFIPASSTADGARAVAAGEADAAVAAPLAAERYQLEILADDIADNHGAVTRFVLVAPAGPPPAPTGADRTSFVAFISDDHSGALLELLTELAVRGVNLTRIESRPTGVALGHYYFSIDAEGHIAYARVAEALAALRRICADVRFLGSYPTADGSSPTERRGTSDADFSDAAAWVASLRTGS